MVYFSVFSLHLLQFPLNGTKACHHLEVVDIVRIPFLNHMTSPTRMCSDFRAKEGIV